MRLNYDLIRLLLLFIEKEADGNKGFLPDDFTAAFSKESPQVIKYHLKYLTDAGLIESVRGYIFDITPRGREYLDNIRDASIWENTKKRFQPLGSVALDVISSIAKSLISSKLGL